MIPRLFIDRKFNIDSPVGLSKTHINYLTNVLRLKHGAIIRLFNGTSGEWEATIEQESAKKINLLISKKLASQNPPPSLTLLFAPTKNINSTYIVEKATELGVTSIQPITTDRTIVRKINKDKLMNSAIEAAEQCERMDIPTIHDLSPLKKTLQNPAFEGKLIFFDESKKGEPIRQLTLNNHDNAILIGPEGGFSDSEREYLLSMKNCKPVHMGERILRADTAAIAGLSAYQALFGDWNGK